MTKPDPWLTSAYLLATTTSLVIIFSISPERLLSQAIWLVVGFGIYLSLSSQDSAVYLALTRGAYPLAMILLLTTIVFGQAIRGSARWIQFGGFQLQSSEIVKPFLVLSFARILSALNSFKLKSFLVSLLYLFLPLLLVLQQPDLGTTLVILTIYIGQLLVAGAPKWLFFLGLVVVIVGIYFAPHLLHDYQLARLEAFIDPTSDPLGSGYNVIQSKIAIGSGGFFGKGLGNGTQSHLRFLPENHTDFIFASLVEELGMLGGIFVIAVLGIIFFRLASIMLWPLRQQERLMIVGIFSYLLFQTFVNIGMNMGIAPVTGVTLPLISYGGSSILGIAISLGIAGSIATHNTAHQDLIEIK